MKYLVFLFVIALLILVFASQRKIEGMKSTCSRPVYGPQNESQFPEMYGPGFHPQTSKVTNRLMPDDGMFDSSTATQNGAYHKVFGFANDGLKLAFPTADGPPEPYLSDFSKFHR